MPKETHGRRRAAEALGYGEEDDFKTFRNQIAELERKISAEEPTEGLFGRLRGTLDDLQKSFFD